MRITDLHIDGFGVWSNLQLDELSEHMTVLYGPNEAGKTTLMQFLRTMLYGYSDYRRQRYLPPVHGGRAGGQIAIEHGDQQYRVGRYPVGGCELGRLDVTDPEGQVRDTSLFDSVLGEVDEATFNNIFAFGLRELQELGSLHDTQAAELLYRLAGGLDRVSLVEVTAALDTARRSLIHEQRSTGQIQRLLQQHIDLDRELTPRSGQGVRWLQLRQQLQNLDGDTLRLTRAIQQYEQHARRIECALQVHDAWHQRATLQTRLAAMGPRPAMPLDAVEQLTTIEKRMQAARGRQRRCRAAAKRIRHEAKQLPINKSLWAQAARIEALGEHAQWITTLESQVQRLQSDIAAQEALLGPTTTAMPEINGQTLDVLRPLAKTVRQRTQQLKQLKQSIDESDAQAGQMQQSLESAVLELGHESLPAAIEEASQRVAQLRKRLQLEQRIDKMTRHRTELMEDEQELVEQQILPPTILAVLGIPFVIGVVLILAGIVWGTAAKLGWPVALLGLAGWVVAVVMKVVLERSAARELDDCRGQLESLQKQLKESKQQREELDTQLPPGGGPLDSRLTDAENQLQQLEQLLPQEAQVQAVQQRTTASQHRIGQLQEALKESRQRWKHTLQRLGLPTDLSPRMVHQLARDSHQTVATRRQLQQTRDELAGRQRELTALSDRIRNLAVSVQVSSSDVPPLELLAQMQAELQQQQQWHQRRETLRRQYRRLKTRHGRYARGLVQWKRRRQSLFAAAGVATLAEFQQLAEQHRERLQLEQQHERLVAQIRAQRGPDVSEEQLANEFQSDGKAQPKNGPASSLETRWEQAESQLQDAKDQLAQLHQRRGQLVQEMTNLRDDTPVDGLRLQMASIEAQLQQAARRWQVLAVCRHVLETVKDIYQRQRQPETLREASQYLAQLTGGHYPRVWTPIESDSLCVDNDRGQALPVDVLSRGAREAVFLSLRLALIASYARRGILLPVILDDVLVNLDSERAKAAARLLRDFARAGHQLLMFTCHEHIMKMCKTAKAEIRHLPNHWELAEAAAVDDPAELDDQLEVHEDEEESIESEYEDGEVEEETTDVVDEDEAYEEEEYEEDEDEEYEEDDAEEYEEEEYEQAELGEEESDQLEDEEEDEDEYDDGDDGDDHEDEIEDETEDEYSEQDEIAEDQAGDEDEVADDVVNEFEDEVEEPEPDANQLFENARNEQDGIPQEERPDSDDPGPINDPDHRRFTWESPERWWDDEAA